MLATIAGFIKPIFTLNGFADYRIVTALIAGFVAKESVVSTLEILTVGTAITAVLSPLAAARFLCSALLYTPAVAAVNACSRELGGSGSRNDSYAMCIAWIFSAAVNLIEADFMSTADTLSSLL